MTTHPTRPSDPAAGDGAYAGIRVLDLSQGVAGPAAVGMLALFGADVIKIEPPAGDWARLMGGSFSGQTALSLTSNLGKRSLCVDATHADGLALLLRLADRADVFVESFRPGVAARLGLDAATLQARHPALVYASISGYGQVGPQSGDPATDSVIQAVSGMMVMNGGAEGPPRRIGMLAVDASNAVYNAHAIGAALFKRMRTGHGERLDLSLLQGAAALQATAFVDHRLHIGRERPAMTVPAGTFATRDGLLNLATVRNAMFFGLCRAIERPDWLADPRFQTNEGRLANAAELQAGLAERLREGTTAEWLARLQQHDVLVGAVGDYDALLAQPQAAAIDLFLPVDQTETGRVVVPRLPGETVPAGPLPPAPRLGEHSRAILAEAGCSQTDIERLVASGVVIAADG